LATGRYRPWYMLWPVALAALFPRSWLAICLLAITFSNSFFDLVEQARPHGTWLYGDTDSTAARVFVAFVPAVLVWYAATAWFRNWSVGILPSRGDTDASARTG